jgi:hypothetical protein
MTKRLKGIAAVAGVETTLRREKVIYARNALPLHAEVYLCVKSGDERHSTAINGTVERMGGILIFSAELPDDAEGDWIDELVQSGCNGLSLRALYNDARWHDKETLLRDVLDMEVYGVELSPFASAERTFAWIEDDGHVTYALPKEISYALMDFYEYSGRPEPILDCAVIKPAVRPSASSTPRTEEMIDADELSVIIPLKTMPGCADLFLSRDGVAVGRLRVTPHTLLQMRDVLRDYEKNYGAIEDYVIVDGDEP